MSKKRYANGEIIEGVKGRIGRHKAEMVNREGSNLIVLNILILLDYNFRYAKIELPIMIALGG